MTQPRFSCLYAAFVILQFTVLFTDLILLCIFMLLFLYICTSAVLSLSIFFYFIPRRSYHTAVGSPFIEQAKQKNCKQDRNTGKRALENSFSCRHKKVSTPIIPKKAASRSETLSAQFFQATSHAALLFFRQCGLYRMNYLFSRDKVPAEDTGSQSL